MDSLKKGDSWESIQRLNISKKTLNPAP